MRSGRRPRAGTSRNRGERVGALDEDAGRPLSAASHVFRSWPSGIPAWITAMPWIKAKSVGGWMGGDDYLRARARR